FDHANERICVPRARAKFFHISQINVYASTKNASEEDKKSHYEILGMFMMAFRDTMDLNAIIGKEMHFRETIANETSIDNGLRLISYSATKN
ncbi:hypothetical protein J437_LFUL010969, partial [Ladona fulva]